MWQADPEDVKILDVRTPEEWVFTGHAPMATNIPFAFLAYAWDDEKKGFPWELNPDFVDLVKAWFAPDDTLLVSCRSGGRATMAINMLAAAGFTNSYNILDGMEGSRVDDQDIPDHPGDRRPSSSEKGSDAPIRTTEHADEPCPRSAQCRRHSADAAKRGGSRAPGASVSARVRRLLRGSRSASRSSFYAACSCAIGSITSGSASWASPAGRKRSTSNAAAAAHPAPTRRP